MIGEGDMAPALMVATTSGETIDLAHPGGPLILYFYPKDHNASDAVNKPIGSGTAL